MRFAPASSIVRASAKSTYSARGLHAAAAAGNATQQGHVLRRCSAGRKAGAGLQEIDPGGKASSEARSFSSRFSRHVSRITFTMAPSFVRDFHDAANVLLDARRFRPTSAGRYSAPCRVRARPASRAPRPHSRLVVVRDAPSGKPSYRRRQVLRCRPAPRTPCVTHAGLTMAQAKRYSAASRTELHAPARAWLPASTGCDRMTAASASGLERACLRRPRRQRCVVSSRFLQGCEVS